MQVDIIEPRKVLNKAYLKVKPRRSEIDKFKTNLIHLIESIDDARDEEYHKAKIRDFLKDTYYGDQYHFNINQNIGWVILNGPKPTDTEGVLIETKKPSDKIEMLTKENLNKKAFHELILFYLQERITNQNREIKHLIATNIYEWFIFDAAVFDKLFAQNKSLVKKFTDFEERRLAGSNTDLFYKEIAETFVAESFPKFQTLEKIAFTHFDIRDYEKALKSKDKQDDNKLIVLYKLLSPEHLLKLPFVNDSNSPDKAFHSELLHLIGLLETKDGSKKVIGRKPKEKRDAGSLLENAMVQLDSMDKISRLPNPSPYGATYQERLFNVALELVITWVNRILFLKVVEAQLVSCHNNDESFSFLNIKKVKNYDDLNSLFFSVTAQKPEERTGSVKAQFAHVPYLNNSLFEVSDIENNTIVVRHLRDELKLPILSSTVLQGNNGRRRTGEMNVLEYFFDFLDAYDFGSEGSGEIQEDNKPQINVSALGLIFEKINGYKEGSFSASQHVTTYAGRETIRKAVVQKFNEASSPQTPLQGGEGPSTVEIQLPPELLQNARDLRKSQTKAEELLWQLLRNRKLNNWKFRRQHPLKEGFILDFYCAETKVAIELDGEYHNESQQKEYDQQRTKILEQYGIQVIRFWNHEVLKETEDVLKRIVEFSSPPLRYGEGSVRRTGGEEKYSSLDDVYQAIGTDFTKQEANKIINSLKICDPAVGSGRFLVFALNEVIAIKSELKVLLDRSGKALRNYHVEVVNGELMVTDDDGLLFKYHPEKKESQRVQEALFHEKQAIIGNCLFGKDINPNALEICRLRLWVELLKNAYYVQKEIQENSSPVCYAESEDLRDGFELPVIRQLQALPDLDINIECGNSLNSGFDVVAGIDGL